MQKVVKMKEKMKARARADSRGSIQLIDINFCLKIDSRYQIESWQIGRPRQAYAHWQNLPEIFYVS